MNFTDNKEFTDVELEMATQEISAFDELTEAELELVAAGIARTCSSKNV
jgi:hypothetical protein